MLVSILHVMSCHVMNHGYGVSWIFSLIVYVCVLGCYVCYVCLLWSWWRVATSSWLCSISGSLEGVQWRGTILKSCKGVSRLMMNGWYESWSGCGSVKLRRMVWSCACVLVWVCMYAIVFMWGGRGHGWRGEIPQMMSNSLHRDLLWYMCYICVCLYI